jgi:hypothetical protein
LYATKLAHLHIASDKIYFAEALNLSKEIIFSSFDSNVSRKISLAEKVGQLKKLALVSIEVIR